jgi:hypothetical protein
MGMGIGALLICSSVLALGGNYFPVSTARFSEYIAKIPEFVKPYLNL